MTTPPEDDPAERAEFWRLTQEALAKHPDALDEDPVWEMALRDGLEDTDRSAASPYLVTISMVTRSRT